MSDKNSSGIGSESQVSGVGQTASIGRSTSVSSGAAKVFREFKWGLLTLFLLMVVVVGLVYDGGAKKKLAEKPKTNGAALDMSFDNNATALPPVPGASGDTFLTPVPGADPGVGAPPPAPGNPLDFAGSPPPLPGGTVTGDSISRSQPHQQAPKPNTGLTGAYVAPDGVTPVPPFQPVDPRLSVVIEPQPPAPKKTYTVKSGDTLSSIVASQKLGKGGLKALIAANKTTLPNPDRLKVGMVLNVPEAASTKPTEANTTQKIAGGAMGATKTEVAPKADIKAAVASDYTVQSGDTLERIARKFFNDGRRWKDIQNWNRDQLADPSRLRIGQVLKIKQLTDAPAKPAKNVKISESETDSAETPIPLKAADATDSLPKPEVAKEKVAAAKEKKAKKDEEPQVEVMSSTSAFAP